MQDFTCYNNFMKMKFYCSILCLLIILVIFVFYINRKETVAIIGAMDVEIEEVILKSLQEILVNTKLFYLNPVLAK